MQTKMQTTTLKYSAKCYARKAPPNGHEWKSFFDWSPQQDSGLLFFCCVLLCLYMSVANRERDAWYSKYRACIAFNEERKTASTIFIRCNTGRIYADSVRVATVKWSRFRCCRSPWAGRSNRNNSPVFIHLIPSRSAPVHFGFMNLFMTITTY